MLKANAVDFFGKDGISQTVAGTHVWIFSPTKSCSLYLNDKYYFSIVMLALVDANYKFDTLNVGSYGKKRCFNFYKICFWTKKY